MSDSAAFILGMVIGLSFTTVGGLLDPHESPWRGQLLGFVAAMAFDWALITVVSL